MSGVERKNLPIDTLAIDAVQSRDQAWTGDEIDRQLAASIGSDGILQDLVVRPLDEVELDTDVSSAKLDGVGYVIIAGSRRYHAAMEAGYETVPCKVVRSDDLEAAWASLVENTDRRELSEQEIANQLKLIFELVRPRADPTSCPDCGTDVEDEPELLAHCDQTNCTLPGSPQDGPLSPEHPDEWEQERFLTEQQALEYLASRYLGRDDDSAVELVEGHLRTAELPPMLQSLFKPSADRTAQERTALENYGIDAQTTLGSGEGKSGTSREVVALHETMESELDRDAVDPTNAVLETVGSLRFEEMSEQELRRTLRDFRHEVTAELDGDESTAAQRETFKETLERCADDLQETYEEIEPTRPFKKVDVLGPETQQHSRWHAQVMQRRDVSGHGELVRELYQERLESLATEEGWK